MGLLRRFQERFGFTRNELTAVIVLSTLFLVGSVIKLWMRDAATPPTRGSYSYAALDSQFLALSRTPRDTVPSRRPTTAKKSAAMPAQASIDVNIATGEEFQSLPGIGPAIASRIITYRNEHGKFAVIDELGDVKGIGPRTLERIRPYLVVRTATQQSIR
jgi:comEA protein